jgi:hypothetical protein
LHAGFAIDVAFVLPRHVHEPGSVPVFETTGSVQSRSSGVLGRQVQCDELLGYPNSAQHVPPRVATSHAVVFGVPDKAQTHAPSVVVEG